MLSDRSCRAVSGRAHRHAVAECQMNGGISLGSAALL
jgi:hypothetical protein